MQHVVIHKAENIASLPSSTISQHPIAVDQRCGLGFLNRKRARSWVVSQKFLKWNKESKGAIFCNIKDTALIQNRTIWTAPVEMFHVTQVALKYMYDIFMFLANFKSFAFKHDAI